MQKLLSTFAAFCLCLILLVATVAAIMATFATFGYLLGYGFVATFQAPPSLVWGVILGLPAFVAMAYQSNPDL